MARIGQDVVVVDAHRYCRLCFIDGGDDTAGFIDLFADKITDKIFDALSIQLILPGIWPSRVCNQCLDTIDRFISFRAGVLANQALLVDRFGDPNEVVEEVIDTAEAEQEEEEQPQYQHQDEAIVEVVETSKKPTRSNDNLRCFSCEDCPKTFSTKYGLTLHRDSHAPETAKQFACPQCPKRFLRKQRLSIHMSSVHTAPEDRPCQCPDCGKRFRNNSTLEDHVKKVHKNLRPFVCEICSLAFKTKHILTEHTLTHTDRVKVKCPDCGKFYQNELQLRRHQKRCHLGDVDEASFRCPECGMQAKNAVALAAHIKLNHRTDPNKFRCEMCPKGFKKPKDLREHMAQHTGQSLYRCAFCTKEFNSSANKYKHQKHLHPEEYEAMKRDRERVMFQEQPQNSK